MNNKMKNIIKYLITFLLVSAVIISVLYFVDYKAPTTSADATATMTTKTLKFVPSKQSKDDKISIPAVGSITLKEGRNNQKVNLFNPKSNNCYFNISLELSDGTILYNTGLLKPNEKITDIMIYKRLERGTYKDCVIRYNCYSLDDKSILNNAVVNIDINVI